MIRFQIFLESPLGERHGYLTLQDGEGQVHGTFSLLGFENPVEGTRTGEEYHLKHQLHTLISDLNCVTTMYTEEEKVHGTLITDRATMKLWGNRIENGRTDTAEKENEIYESAIHTETAIYG